MATVVLIPDTSLKDTLIMDPALMIEQLGGTVHILTHMRIVQLYAYGLHVCIW